MVAMMKAKDFHYLLSCHEAEAMVLTAEMQLRASQLRKESRGWFLREDYPETDNKNWLKLIMLYILYKIKMVIELGREQRCLQLLSMREN